MKTRMLATATIALIASSSLSGIAGWADGNVATACPRGPQAQPAAGCVSLTRNQVPLVTKNNDTDGSGVNTSVQVDPSAGLLIESSDYSCPGLAEIDLNTNAVVATNGKRGDPASCRMTRPGHYGYSKMATTVVDPASHVLFLRDISNPNTSNSINVVTERPMLGLPALQHLASWQLGQTSQVPSGPGVEDVKGMSWFGGHPGHPADELIVISDAHSETAQNGGVDAPPGLTVRAISVPLSLQTVTANNPGHAVVLWTVRADPCSYALQPQYTSRSAYIGEHLVSGRLEPAVFVPCQIIPKQAPSQFQGPYERDGIVTIGLGPTGCSAGAQVCPDGKPAVVAAAPAQIGEFMFDPQSDRGFIPMAPTGQGTQILVFEGRTGVYLGRSAISGGEDGQNVMFALDERTGRAYAVGQHSGLHVIDGRRTPVPQGTIYPGVPYPAGASNIALPVLPPTDAFPYTRLLVPHMVGTTSTYPTAFDVYADLQPVVTDPPPSTVDDFTYPNGDPSRGPLSPGARVLTKFGGSARGYGFHVDVVGGPGGAINNVTAAPGTGGTVIGDYIPFGPGNRDLMGAVVNKLDLTNGSSSGSASALSDVDGSTGGRFAVCTSAASLQNCAQPPPGTPQPPTCFKVFPPDPTKTPPSLCSLVPPRGQALPYPTASCADSGQGDASGISGVNPSDGTAVEIQRDDLGAAHVDCASVTQGVPSSAGWAHTGGTDISQSHGSPTVHVGSAAVPSATVVSPGAEGVVTATTSAEAHDIRLSVPNGTEVEIGMISQTATASAGGRPGSATAEVTVRNVFVKRNGQGSGDLCPQSCSQAALDQINREFAGYLEVRMPPTDDRYNTPGLDPNDPNRGAGSPGGYTAVVANNLTDQYGDQQFDNMSVQEAAYHPALRVVLYDPLDGQPTLNRAILDFAGVNDEARLGIEVDRTGSGGGPCTAADIGTASSGPAALASTGANSTQAPTTAEVSSTCAAAAAVAAGIPASIVHGPGSPVAASNQTSSSGDGSGQGGIVKVVAQIFEGIRALFRGWRAAFQMLGVLLVLGLPMLLIVRRRVLTANIGGLGA